VEVPALWFERKHGTSRFRVLKWLAPYLRWYAYAFATTLLCRPASSVPLKSRAGLA
jgi:dolichol-phosphate mannosyltransferase